MNTKEEISRVVERLGCQDYSEYSFDELLSQYDTLKSLEAFNNSPTHFLGGKKAKEIALDAALKLYAPSTQTAELLLKDAQSIFEWLTK